jgi:hypothetical protein
MNADRDDDEPRRIEVRPEKRGRNKELRMMLPESRFTLFGFLI